MLPSGRYTIKNAKHLNLAVLRNTNDKEPVVARAYEVTGEDVCCSLDQSGSTTHYFDQWDVGLYIQDKGPQLHPQPPNKGDDIFGHAHNKEWIIKEAGINGR